ncbi:hypothetical protein F4777DRAFT_588113 [Nemania sp. FL0916]|nr:hypothetical protein F4777DRAFT_588113 [Nemania sp. FL0916]
MFQWYAGAAVCYAYLSDVVSDQDATEGDTVSGLKYSRWVSRGWTLQELIAPREVVFYSCDWQAFGTRTELSAILAAITCIDESYLRGRPLDHASVAQRMSWAARRETSRVEDQAYCLLGIFNVNMPLIYGERSKAFRRLQEAIVREYPQDHSLYAWGKLVTRFSYEVRDKMQLWGRHPIEHDPGLAKQHFFGLFAESPADFINSGEVVRSPLADAYLEGLEENSQPPFAIGHATQVKFPLSLDTAFAAFHLKCPPIVQVRTIRYACLLCGIWDSKRDDFHYIIIPEVVNGSQVSRTDEIVIHRRSKLSQRHMRDYTKTYIYKVLPPYRPRKGGLVFRRIAHSIPGIGHRTNGKIFESTGRIWLNPPRSLWGTLYALAFQPDASSGFVVYIERTSPVTSGHTSDGVDTNGRLRIGVALVKTWPERAPSANIKSRGSSQVSIREAPEGPTERPRTGLPHEDPNQVMDYYFSNPDKIPRRHDMEIPRDEWRIDLDGYADVYVAVERVGIDDDGYDDYIGEQMPDCFVDVIDLVIRVPGDPGYKGTIADPTMNTAGHATHRSRKSE